MIARRLLGALLASALSSPRVSLAEGSLFSEEPIPDVVTSTLAPAEAPTAEEPPAFTPRVTWALRLGASVGVDTSFDRKGEQILEVGLRGAFELHCDLTPELSAHALPRFSQVTALDREGGDRAALFLEVPEAYATLAHGPLRLRAGTLVHAWGSTNIFVPTDVLNPVDLRQPLGVSRGAMRIPVLGAEVSLALPVVSLRAVVQPFFTPSRFYLAGWDSGVAPLLGAQAALLPDLDALLGRPTADIVSDQLFLVDRPSVRPDHLTVGLRAIAALDDLELAGTFVWGYEPLPRINIDPDLSAVGGAVLDAIATKRPIDFFDAEVLAALGRLQDKLASGSSLLAGTYPRRVVIGLDGSYSLDPIVLAFDAAYSPERTHYTQTFTPITLPAIDASIGVEYADGEELQLTMEAFGIFVLDVPGSVRLAILEPRASGEARDRAVILPGAALAGSYSLLDGELRLRALLVTTFSRQDLMVSPQIEWRLSDAHRVSLTGLAIEGRADGYGGAYSHNDQLILGYEWAP